MELDGRGALLSDKSKIVKNPSHFWATRPKTHPPKGGQASQELSLVQLHEVENGRYVETKEDESLDVRWHKKRGVAHGDHRETHTGRAAGGFEVIQARLPAQSKPEESLYVRAPWTD